MAKIFYIPSCCSCQNIYYSNLAVPKSKTSINHVECVYSDTILLSTNMAPTSSENVGPTMYAQGSSLLLSAVGVETSPAFFILNPGENDFVGVSGSIEQDVNLFFSFYKKTFLYPENIPQ